MLSKLSLRAVLLTGVAATATGFAANDAAAYTARVRAACSGDYSSFCPSYPVNSTQLRSCMRATGKRLSTGCLEALVDAGEVDRSVLKKRR